MTVAQLFLWILSRKIYSVLLVTAGMLTAYSASERSIAQASVDIAGADSLVLDSSEQSASTPVSQGVSHQEWETEQASVELNASSLSNVQISVENMAQVTSVSQLSDVQPTDWAFPALQSLVERYGCIAGYPDGSFRGDRALSRYEFAAGVNACLDRINELLASGLADTVSRDDLVVLQRLQEEFAAELAALRGRVDALEARTAELEANQFSTTTKLFGQIVLGLQGRTENDFQFFLDELEDDETNINLITNVQLSLLTQFNRRSILLTGLQVGNGRTVDDGPALTNFFRLGYEGDTDNDVRLSDLTFRQLIGNDFSLIVGTEGVNAVNVFRGTNRVESAGFGPISVFAQRNPVISIGNGSAGAGFDWQIGSRFSLQGVYSASQADAPDVGGLFGGEQGETAVAAQLVATPFNNFDIALQYVNAYSPFGRLGSGVGDDQVAILGPNFRAPINTNAVGTSMAWQITPTIALGGWAGYTNSDLQGDSGNVETINWMAFLNVSDLFAEGNVAGLYVGQPPKIISSDLPDGRNVPSFINEGDFTAQAGDQPGTATHVEAFYRMRVNDHIFLTPGFVLVFNPGHNSENDTIFQGALRTTFVF